MPRHAYELSLPAFRPSLYSTGLQSSQPYTPEWPEGTTYGDWTNWIPGVGLYRFVRDSAKVAESEGAVSGTCVDHAGIVGQGKGVKVPCSVLYDAHHGNPAGTTHSYHPDGPVNLTSLIPAALKPSFLLTDEEKPLKEKQDKDKENEDEKEKLMMALKVGAFLALSVATFVTYKRYKASKAAAATP